MHGLEDTPGVGLVGPLTGSIGEPPQEWQASRVFSPILPSLPELLGDPGEQVAPGPRCPD